MQQKGIWRATGKCVTRLILDFQGQNPLQTGLPLLVLQAKHQHQHDHISKAEHHSMLMWGIFAMQDNAHPHVTYTVQDMPYSRY
jgi:hypothetical protein